MLDTSNRKPSKIWEEKGNEFYKIWMKSLLRNNDIEMHSTHNEEKSVTTKRYCLYLDEIGLYW